MYPTLQADPKRAAWIETTAAELRSFGERHRGELDDANRRAHFPRDLYRELGKLGYLGPLVPPEYGGLGGGVAEYVVISEEVGRHGLVSGQIAAQGQRWLLDWGTDEQKDRWLRGIATGEALFYANAQEGLTSFLVDMTLPGIETAVTDPVGLRLIRTADVIFDRVRVTDAALLGPPGGGLQTFLSTFNISRLGNASELIGLGRRSLEVGLRYASQRQVGAEVVTDFQGIQWMVADAWTALQAASLARDDAAVAHERGEDIALRTTTAKHLAITAAERASDTAYSLTGGHGLYFGEPYTDIAGDIKVLKVAGGSAEIMRNYIARRVLKDPGHEGLA